MVEKISKRLEAYAEQLDGSIHVPHEGAALIREAVTVIEAADELAESTGEVISLITAFLLGADGFKSRSGKVYGALTEPQLDMLREFQEKLRASGQAYITTRGE